MSTAFETEEIVESRHYESTNTISEGLRIDEPHAHVGTPQDQPKSDSNRRIYAMFCFEAPESIVGQSVAMLAQGMAKQNTPVHIFSREAFELDTPGIYVHALGGDTEGTLFAQVQDFMRRACNAFLREFHAAAPVAMMAFEWSSIPAVSLLRSIRNIGFVLSLHSLERQRSNTIDGIGKYIEETELSGLREARLILCSDAATADVAKRCVPECAAKLETLSPMTLIRDFQFELDPGEVKGRFQIGPTDPTILFVGDLSETYGPDALMKAMPRILRNHKQARCVFIGDGDLLWPLRVTSRYLLLDYAVRLAGHLDGQALRELVYAADVVVVPSRGATPWWPIEAAWAANRPVVTTSEAAVALVNADKNALMVEAEESSIAAGVERIMNEPDLARSLAAEGREKLEERYSITKVVARIEELLGASLEQDRAPMTMSANMTATAGV
jgi:glycosyltransferase involved in cell wall biosynthesis